MAFQGKAGLSYHGGNQGRDLASSHEEPALNPSQTDEPVEEEGTEAEALIEMERRIEWEKPKFQPLDKELESINMGNEMEKREVRVGKQMPPDLRTKLMELLKEFACVRLVISRYARLRS
ncbi:hypothetical protein CR513_56320, partial [Mucuna pruriens]